MTQPLTVRFHHEYDKPGECREEWDNASYVPPPGSLVRLTSATARSMATPDRLGPDGQYAEYLVASVVCLGPHTVRVSIWNTVFPAARP